MTLYAQLKVPHDGSVLDYTWFDLDFKLDLVLFTSLILRLAPVTIVLDSVGVGQASRVVSSLPM